MFPLMEYLIWILNFRSRTHDSVAGQSGMVGFLLIAFGQIFFINIHSALLNFTNRLDTTRKKTENMCWTGVLTPL